MKTIKLALCDDEPVALRYITQTVQNCFLREGVTPVLYTFQNSSILLNKLKTGILYDVLFLDIDMPDVDGLQLAKQCNILNPRPIIIFISSREEYVYQAIKVQPYRFIRKKTFTKEISECIHSLLHEMPETVQHPYVIFTSNNTLYRLNINDIYYVEVINKHLHFHMKSGDLTVRFKLSDMEQLLSKYHFLRIHKSFLVNAQAVFTIETKEVVLLNGERLPLSRIYAQEAKKIYQEM